MNDPDEWSYGIYFAPSWPIISDWPILFAALSTRAVHSAQLRQSCAIWIFITCKIPVSTDKVNISLFRNIPLLRSFPPYPIISLNHPNHLRQPPVLFPLHNRFFFSPDLQCTAVPTTNSPIDYYPTHNLTAKPMQAATTAATRHHRPRRVIYKSSALERTAPHLVAAASAEAVSAARSIQNANAAAERVRLSYKENKTLDVGNAVDGDDDASNAQKYERRLKMNRQSAAASRVRREAYTKALEAELVKMENEFRQVHLKLKAALERNQHLEDSQEVTLIDDGTALELKQEDEEEPDLEAVEEVEQREPTLSPDVHADVTMNDDDLAAALPSQIIQHFQLDMTTKVEGLLSDPSLIDNPDVLSMPVPDALPECFLFFHGENGDSAHENDFS